MLVLAAFSNMDKLNTAFSPFVEFLEDVSL